MKLYKLVSNISKTFQFIFCYKLEFIKTDDKFFFTIIYGALLY